MSEYRIFYNIYFLLANIKMIHQFQELIYFLNRIQYRRKKKKQKSINSKLPFQYWIVCHIYFLVHKDKSKILFHRIDGHLFPLRKTEVLRYWTRSPNKYLTSSNGILSEALSNNTSSQFVTVSNHFSLFP